MLRVPQSVGQGQGQARASASAREGLARCSGTDGRLSWLAAAKAFALSLLERRSGLGSDGDTPLTTEVISDHQHLPFPGLFL